MSDTLKLSDLVEAYGEQQEVKNAVIEKAEIINRDFGVTISITIKNRIGSQGFGGGISLGGGSRWESEPNYAGHFMSEVMNTAGVKQWSGIIGAPVRSFGNSGKIYAIGNFLYDFWFCPYLDFAEEKEADE